MKYSQSLKQTDKNHRLAKCIKFLQQQDLDGLIIYSKGAVHILRPAYFYYFTGVRPLDGKSAVVVSKSGQVVLLMESSCGIGRVAGKTWISDIRDSVDFTCDLPSIMRELKIDSSVGIAGIKEISTDVYDKISQIAVARTAENIVEALASDKSEHELAIVRRTAKIADRGFHVFLESIRPGIREYELIAETGYAMRAAGADDIFMLISSERHNKALHRPLDKRMELGDTIIVEMAPFCEGQCVQVCRTVYIGKPNKILKEKYQLLVRAFNASLEKIKPGLPASAMSIVMNKIITKAGYGEYCRPPHMRARGHGFGVGSISPGPVIDDVNNVIVKPGQVLISHPNQYFPETGYLACGETVMVIDNGFERLLHSETRLYSKEF